jgi:hypothetical protein
MHRSSTRPRVRNLLRSRTTPLQLEIRRGSFENAGDYRGVPSFRHIGN